MGVEKYTPKRILGVGYGDKTGEMGFYKNGPYYTAPHIFVVDKKGNIFIADSYKHQIHKFNAEGKYALSLGGRGNEEGKFAQWINNVGVDYEGNVYALDYWNYRIQKFDNNGKYLLKIKSLKAGPRPRGQDTYIDSMKVAPSGRIYMSDRDTEGWQIYNHDGKFIHLVRYGDFPGESEVSLIEDEKGFLHKISTRPLNEILAKQNKSIKRKHAMKIIDLSKGFDIHKKDRVINEFDLDLGEEPPAGYLGYDDNGNLYVFYQGKYSKGQDCVTQADVFVRKYDGTGNLIAQIDLSPSKMLMGGGDIVIDNKGDIYQMNLTFKGIEIIKYSKETEAK